MDTIKRRDFLLSLGALGLAGPYAAMGKLKGEIPHEGVELDYRVLFGGNEIGHQTISVSHHDQPGKIAVNYKIDLEVRILFAVAYSLEHDSTEVWDHHRKLHAIKSRTVENGKTSLVHGGLEQGGFHVKGNNGVHKGPGDMITSDSFWLAAALDSHSVMNTRTGDIAKPKVKKLKEGHYHLKAEFAHGPIEANLHYKDDFLLEAEIDSDGHVIRFERINV